MKRRSLAHRFSEGKLDRLGRYNDASPPRYVSPEKVDEAFDSLPPKAVASALEHWLKKQETKVSRIGWSASGACISAIAMSALTVASAALTHEAKLYLKPSHQYPVSPRLWRVLLGNPSTMKTPVMEGSARPMRKFQKEMEAQLYQEWRDQLEAQKKTPDEEDYPRLPQYVVNDLTPERLVDILANQNRGLLVFADELAGWLGSLEWYGSGKGAASNRAVWLQAYNGGPYNLLRMGRPTRPVDNLSVSILGGIQPERLRELGSLQSDGLLQRFIPVMMSKPNFEANTFDARGFIEWNEVVRKLLNYKGFTTELSPEAQAIRMVCAKSLYTLGQGDNEGPSWQGFLGKLNGVWGSFALLLPALWGHPATEKISAETADRATVLINEFVLPHGLAFYRSLVGTGQTDAKAIGAFLALREGTRVSVRDIARGPSCCRGLSSEEIIKKVASFEVGGWLQPFFPGPWNKDWTVAPGLMEQFSQEVRAHMEAARAIQEKIASRGGSRRV
jgi:hypothetical protein